MRNINLFVEDVAHEDFLTALIKRYAGEYSIEINCKASSVRGGRGTVLTELKQFVRDLQQNKEILPDLVIVGTDSNCKGLIERENELNNITSNISEFVINMIPDPHIERWFLLDSEAFKNVYDEGCDKPDNKCERGRYKKMFLNAIYQATMIPPIDGTERLEELVNAMDLQRIEQNDKSIKRFLSALNRKFRFWQQEKQ